MRTFTEIRREGELLGPVDWSYNFLQHFGGYCCDDAGRQKVCDEKVAALRKLCDGGNWMATTDGGWPRMCWGKVLAVGMYDGWPYWRPVPSVMIASIYGGGWHTFDQITGVMPERRET